MYIPNKTLIEIHIQLTVFIDNIKQIYPEIMKLNAIDNRKRG